ncbi:MAG: reverse transcriptase/maturase family protein [Nanoarchaeota archaeon]
MRTFNNIYPEIYSMENLFFAYKKARKGKTRKDYVIEFEENLADNLIILHYELKNQTYAPRPLDTFILRDPKTRKISKSDFRDRIVHHALVRVIGPIFEKIFIYDSCANRKGKGNLFALKRFHEFIKKVSRNGKFKGWFNKNQIKGYCLKADIKHYFQKVDHEVILNIIKEKIADKKVVWLIEKILDNNVPDNPIGKGMPLGNLTSQFLANVYLNKLDYFVKNKLKVRYYLRYVDDFVLLSPSKKQLSIWRGDIENFLSKELKIELHPDKSRIIPLSRGIDFVGFRNFYFFKFLRKRNVKKMEIKVRRFANREINKDKMIGIFQGWNAHSKWANSLHLRRKIISEIYKISNSP